MANGGRNGAPRSPQPSMSVGLVYGNRRMQSGVRRNNRDVSRRSLGKELVPSSQQREGLATNSAKPSQSSSFWEINRLRAQLLALQRDVRCRDGNKDWQLISLGGGESCGGENTLGHLWKYQERLSSPPSKYREKSASPPHRHGERLVSLISRHREKMDSPPPPPRRNRHREFSPCWTMERVMSLRRN